MKDGFVISEEFQQIFIIINLEDMEGKAKLHYFKAFGRAEPIRFALSATGVEFEEVVLKNKMSDGEDG